LHRPQADHLGGQYANANEIRAIIQNDPLLHRAYLLQAAAELGAQRDRAHFIVSGHCDIEQREHNPGIWTGLNVDRPVATIDLKFNRPAIIKRCTATVQGWSLTPGGMPEPGVHHPTILNYIWVLAIRASGDQMFMNEPVPLSVFAGTPGVDPGYKFDLFPLMQETGVLQVEIGIAPPGFPRTAAPPYVNYTGMVQLNMHAELHAPSGT